MLDLYCISEERNATIVRSCLPYGTGDDTPMTVPRPSADFEPDLVLLLHGDPNDAVTRALVSGRAQLGWPLVAVSAQQMLDGIELGDAWTVAGRRVDPQRTAVVNRLPAADHAEWLRVNSGELVKSVHQRFIDADGGVVMVSDVSYPRDRYEAFVFRMTLD